MDVVLHPYTPYFDKIVILSSPMRTTCSTYGRCCCSCQAGLTANPKKYQLGLTEAQHLGYRNGWDLLTPQTTDTCLFGAGRFMANFFLVASPLSDLTRKSKPEKVQWTEQVEWAFHMLKSVLPFFSILWNPKFNCPFLVQMPWRWSWVPCCHRSAGMQPWNRRPWPSIGQWKSWNTTSLADILTSD